MKEIELSSFLVTIEDGLINSFDHFNRTASFYLEGRHHDIEVFYDTLTGKLEAMIHSEDARKKHPNIEKAIVDGISTDKILNEIRLEEMEDDEKYESEMDNRLALDRADGFGFGIFW